MADETLFDFLHSEVINYTLETNELKNKESKDEDLSTIEYIGFSTGYRIIERLTKEMQRFKDELDTMKFICTDFWSAVYKKQIDNLRTNHQGVYVLQDNAFKFLTKLSSGKQYLEAAPRYVAFTCGVIRETPCTLLFNITPAVTVYMTEFLLSLHFTSRPYESTFQRLFYGKSIISKAKNNTGRLVVVNAPNFNVTLGLGVKSLKMLGKKRVNIVKNNRNCSIFPIVT